MPYFKLTRRTFLRGFLATGCVLCLPQVSNAEAGKLSKELAQYKDRPNGDKKCANCTNFIAPNACKLVDGNINPNGWCTLWVKKQE